MYWTPLHCISKLNWKRYSLIWCFYDGAVQHVAPKSPTGLQLVIYEGSSTLQTSSSRSSEHAATPRALRMRALSTPPRQDRNVSSDDECDAPLAVGVKDSDLYRFLVARHTCTGTLVENTVTHLS